MQNASSSKSSAGARKRGRGAKALSILISAALVLSLSPLVQSSYAGGGGDKPAPGTYGNISYSLNTQTDAFLHSAYDQYRDGNDALGIANNFHLVAFDTLNAPVDVYGNILAKNLASAVDTGTSDKFVNIYGYHTLSYVQNYSGTFPRWDKSADGCMVFGSEVELDTRNNCELVLNGSRIEKPDTIVQDADTQANPFIDLKSLKTKLSTLSSSLKGQETLGATQKLINDGKVRNITINEGYTGCAYLSLTAAELQSSYEGINVDNLPIKTGSALVINVDCQGATSIDLPKTYLRVNGRNVGIGEVDEEYGDTGYVLYNFYNTANKLPITVHECTASILAPNASLTLGPGSACGTFIGSDVTVAAESHIRPFHGKLKPSEPSDDTTSIDVSKVWKDASGKLESEVEHQSITVELFHADAEGNATKAVENDQGKAMSVELNQKNSWSASWSDLPTKDSNGKVLHYTVKESSVPSGYVSKVSGSGGSFTITNTRKQVTESFSLRGYSVRAADAPEPGKVCYVDPKVMKVLEGRALKDGEFSFQLIDQTGAVVSQTTNDAAGMVDFDKVQPAEGSDAANPSCLSFNAAGTYTYTVRETPGASRDSTVEYSNEVIQFVTTIGERSDHSLYEEESHYVKYPNAADAQAKVNGVRYSSSDHPSITNKVKPISLALVKTDAKTGAKLKGATYGLYRADGSASGGTVQVMSATSNADGVMVFTSTDSSLISEGNTYFFREISAPEGYTVAEGKTESFSIAKSSDGEYALEYEDGTSSQETYSGTVSDPIVFKDGTGVSDSKVEVTFNKISSNNSALSGAKLAVLDGSGSSVASWTSDETGHVVSSLSIGTEYTLHEESAPEGYKLAADVSFTVDEHGKVILSSGAEQDGAINAYTSDSTLNLVDYKQAETVKTRKTVHKASAPATASTRTTPKTGDTLSLLPIAAFIAMAAIMLGTSIRRRRRG